MSPMIDFSKDPKESVIVQVDSEEYRKHHLVRSIELKKQIDKLVENAMDNGIAIEMIIFLLNKKIIRMMGE